MAPGVKALGAFFVLLSGVVPIHRGGKNNEAAQGPATLANRLAALLSDYWYVAVILTAILFWFIKTPPRRLADPHESAAGPAPLLVEGLPELASEIERLLMTAGETGLAAQISGLKIVDRCRCGDDFCSTFYEQPKPDGPFGPGHRSVDLTPQVGSVRDEIRQKLQALLP